MESTFAIPELLEKILLQLSMKDILLSQAVSKDWNAAIQHSTKLQEARFFRSAPLSEVYIIGKGTASTIRFSLGERDDLKYCYSHANELRELATTNQEWIIGSAKDDELTRTQRDVRYMRKAKLNPPLFSSADHYEDTRLNTDIDYFVHGHQAFALTSHPRPGASCNKLYLTQPPCTFATLDDLSMYWEHLRKESGLKFEDMVEAWDAACKRGDATTEALRDADMKAPRDADTKSDGKEVDEDMDDQDEVRGSERENDEQDQDQNKPDSSWN